MIGLDFVGGQSGDTSSMATTESAGVVAQTNWNNLTSNAGTSTTIKNSSGTTLSGVSVTYNSTNTWSDTGVSNTAGNNRMMRGYLDINVNTPGTATTVTVNGLSSLGYYDVYVYTAGDGNNRTGKFTIGNQTYWVNDNATFNGTFVRGTGQVNPGSYSNATAGNYMVFSALSGSSVSLTAQGAYATDAVIRAPVNGMQIVQLPTSYWDLNGATAGAGATPTGTWSSAATNWSSSSAGTATTGTWTSGNLAVFSAGTDATSAYTVTVSGTQTASSIIVEEGSPTFTGGVITLNGTTPQVNVASGSTAIINSQISSTAGLTKTGAGTLVVGSTANAYTGPTVVQTGTLTLGANNVIPNTSALIVQSGATLNLNNYNDTVASLAGSGIITLGSGTLTVGDSTNTTFSGSFTSGSTGTLAKTGSGTLTFGAGMNLASGTLVLNGGTLNLGGFTSTFGSLSVTANSVLDFGASGASILKILNSVTVASGVTLTITDWTNAVDYFYALNNPGSANLGRIVFTGFTPGTANWLSYDQEVSPVPEPSVYGAALLGLSTLFAGWRLHRRRTA